MSSFIDKVKDGAIDSMTEHKILASVTIAQAILESGWGRSELSCKANNLFGVKYSSTFKGDKILYPTKEFINGRWITIDAYFRKYNSFNESIKDHAYVLLQPRYKALIGVTDYKKACKIIYECGYATDPNYPSLLISLIEENKLYNYDKIEVKKIDTSSELYIVKKGDTLSQIGEAYGIDYKLIASWNKIKNVNKIKVGDVLKVREPLTHRVKKGDTLFDLAIKYNTTVTKLVNLNGISNKNLITIGQVLKIR